MNKSEKPIAFDHHSREHARNWNETCRQLRASGQVARGENHGGYWVLTRYDDVRTMLQTTDTFSSGKWQDEKGEWQGGITIPPISGRLIPDETDPPEWKMYRHLLNPRFTPKAILRTKELTERVASVLLDAVIETGRVDMVEDLANPLPAIMTLHMMDLPLEHWREYAEPSHEAIFSVPGTPAYTRAVQRLQWGEDQMLGACKARRGNPGDDLLSYIANARHDDGSYYSDEELGDINRQVLGGGVDTTTSLMANAFIYLSNHPEAKKQLIDRPEIEAYACEEFIRFYAPIHTTSRNVKKPFTIAGTTFAPGDKVLASYASANRDETVFEDPDTIKLDRFPNPHIGFGVGVHRCLGSHMARLAFTTLLREVLRRMPDFRVDESKAERYATIGVVNGWVRVPATFTPGKRENRDPDLAKLLRLERS
jgi:cytochrome P450